MELSELYFEILGIKEPWYVNETIFDNKKKRVDVYLKHSEDGAFRCPFCNKKSPIYDHSEERVWRHLDTCDLQTYVHAKLPRIDCAEHFVQQVDFNWAKDHSRFTWQMERFILRIISSVETISKASEICKIGWNVLFKIMKRYLEQTSKSKKNFTLFTWV